MITLTKTAKNTMRGLCLAAAATALVACDGANQGVQIGTGQDPDPVIVDFPIAYIRAPIPLDDDGNFEQSDLREQITFNMGSDVFFRDRAAPGAPDTNLTGAITGGMGAVRDLEIDFDASRIVFSMRLFDPDLGEDDQPTWNIWQYTFETGELIRLIPSDLTAEIGHDIMPKFLPNGQIIFASTRQVRSQAVLLDESKPGFIHVDEDGEEFAFNLHVMNDRGAQIEQLTFNQSHDLDPSVLSDGRVIFSRWDNSPGNDQIDLYRMAADGSNVELLYGKESHDTGTNGQTIQFVQPREEEDGRILTLVRPFSDTEDGGALVSIDVAGYVENTQPVASNAGGTGPAQEEATFNQVLTQIGNASPDGRYRSAYPIQDGTGRLLVSWSQCRLLETDIDNNVNIVPCTEERLADPVTFPPAPPLYGIWIYDPRDETQQPVVVGEEGFMFTEVVSGDPRPIPPNWQPDPADLPMTDQLGIRFPLEQASEAILNIRSVYDFDGAAIVDIDAASNPSLTPAANLPIRFVRIEKVVSFPDEDTLDIDNTAFGLSQANGMREIIGYAEVAPDGSVLTKIPANVALSLTLLDENGHRRSQRHNNWLAARPGQELSCNGCHVGNQGVSHGRYEAFDSVYAGAQSGLAEFPGTRPQGTGSFIPEVGDTMSEWRARNVCEASTECDAIDLNVNLEYVDNWSADPTVAANNGFISRRYATSTSANPDIPLDFGSYLEGLPIPVDPTCESDWNSLCRIVINYQDHIQPIWDLPRIVTDPADDTIIIADNTCVACHTRENVVDPAVQQVPAGQLELTSQPSDQEANHYTSYRELLAGDNLQEVVGGVLIDAQQVIGQDADGNDILATIPIGSPAQLGSARGSGDFFDRFADPADIHFNLLSEAERRLIAEWLDIGAQYFNNPFNPDVPLD